MNVSRIAHQEDAAILAAVMDVHCRERGIDPSSDEAGKIADVVRTLIDQGTSKPDDIRAALLARSERDGAEACS